MGVTLILSGLEQSEMYGIVVRQTLCGALDTVEAARSAADTRVL